MTEIKIKGLPKFKLEDYNYLAVETKREVYILDLNNCFKLCSEGERLVLPRKYHVDLLFTPTDHQKSTAGIFIKVRR